MKKKMLFLLFLLFVLPLKQVVAQTLEADSVDVLHYDLRLDMGNQVTKQLRATADITFVLTRNCNSVTFSLMCDSLFPVSLDGIVTRGFNYDQDECVLTVYLNGGTVGDTHVVSVPYASNGYIEPYGWGGLHIDNNMYYTLGVAFKAYPHVFGRSWFPCRDNFYDKATYRFTVTSKPGWRAICSGLKQSETNNADGSNTSVWTLEHLTPTYLVSISSADWHTIERTYQGYYDTYPAIIGYTTQDSAAVYSSYAILDDVIPAYERAFGPYRWDRVGYISTEKGSMEHVNNIGLVSLCMDSRDNSCQMVICHELGHAWFGNLVTCASEGDMWINEGGATFCEEVATEAVFGHEAAVDYYQGKVMDVLRGAHHEDQGWRALSDMSEYYTYGTTTYQKGALVWHSLRGLMGDSLFYDCMHRLFDRCAFGNIDAASLRDSLSLYSGMDLTDFFDFHVFNPGFVDYSIENMLVDGNECTLRIRQLLRGTDHYARHSRVPITFFGTNSTQREKIWFDIDDTLTELHVALSFSPSSVVVDLDHELSDACTDDMAAINHKALYDMPHAYCKVYTNNDNVPNHSWVHVGHHFAHPTGDTVAGIVRMTDRYWQVTGNFPSANNQGRFLYNQGGNGSSGASYIDYGFYDNRATLDSLCLLYRVDATEPWQIISRSRTNTSSTLTGYFSAPLYPGQYTLGVCDPDMPLMQIATPETTSQLKIYPNPSQHLFRIDMGGYDKKFDLVIYDNIGKKILEMNDLHDGDVVRHHLPAGSYIVIIQNNFLSLQSQIIVQ